MNLLSKTEYREGGHCWGMHRVIKPHGGLPQQAEKLDSSLPPFDNEIFVKVRRLQIDSASFHRLKNNASGNSNLQDRIMEIIGARGKMHNPATNSGGVFLGKVEFIGPRHPLKGRLNVGDEVVSLVSLTLTPLAVKKIHSVDEKRETVDVDGHAIIFESGSVKKMPEDFAEGVVLASLDVCGAPAQARRLVRPGDKVLVAGLGKAGKSVCVQVMENGGLVFGLDESEESVSWCKKNLHGHFESLDARNASAVFEWVSHQTGRALADIAVLAANVGDTEMPAILSCRDGGRVLFFGMQTSFQKAVLGAEGFEKDVELMMGNGFVPGHADLMLNLLRKNRPLRQWFEEKYG